MNLIVETSHCPYHNLSMEEALFLHSEEDILYLWRNQPSVIVGRNQNTLAEVNQEFTKAHDIQIGRRQTGGGAVFHDLGNINLSYIFHCKEDGSDFDKHCQWLSDKVIAYLQSINVHAQQTGRNDICIWDQEGNLRKIAGTAMTQRENKGLFHLCILFDVNMDHMAQALTPSIEKLQAKGVTSLRSRTMNLRNAEPSLENWTADTFFHHLKSWLNELAKEIHPDSSITSKLGDIQTNRYKNPHWTFGRNPLGTFCSSHRFPIGTIELSIEIAKGKISQCHFGGDYLTTMDLEPIAQCLTGTWFQEEDIAKVLDDYEIEKILKITHRKEFIDFILGRSSTCISLN